jgi:hypothetical protein
MAKTAEVHHEESDVNLRAILAFGAGLTLVMVVVLFLMWLLFGYFRSREAQSGTRDFPLAVEQQNRMPPEPRLQTNPREDLRVLRARDEALLKSYGWTDKDAGIARIPIEEAMKLTVQRGLPARRGNEAAR